MRDLPFFHIFNPDHDLALGNNDSNYMPPASARRLAEDLTVLPVWYARSRDRVLALSQYNRGFIHEMKQLFTQLPALLTESEIAENANLQPSPWGWDPAICKRLLLLGVPADKVPTAEQMNLIRLNSHRSLAVELLAALQFDEYFCGESFYYTDSEKIQLFIENRENCLLKAPLSGSGKGLNWCKGVFTSHIQHWCKHIIAQQGGVVAEPSYQKVIDFAMQFYIHTDGVVRFQGFSLFQTNDAGAYVGNNLVSNEEIRNRLTCYIPDDCLSKIRKELEERLAVRLRGVYTGYVGVDMMICRFPEAPQFRLHPCVEVNLRMTMGMTARLFYDRYVQPGATGTFRVDYFPSTPLLTTEQSRLLQQYPLQLKNGRVASGYMPLVPATPKSQYSAWVLIDDSAMF